MSIVKLNGISYFVVDGLPLSGVQIGSVAKYAVNMEILYEMGKRKQFSMIAQFYGLVIPGLILSSHLFQGLNRNLYCDNEFNGDAGKYVFSRKPAYDYYWEGGTTGREVKKLAPASQVFVVVVSKNIKHQEKFPDVDGWVDHWNWVDEDPYLSEAPINWIDRYESKIWSKD